MSEIEYVRVKDPVSGHEFTTSSINAENSGLTVLEKKEAVDQIGRPLPAKNNVGAPPKQPNNSPDAGKKEG